MIPTIVIKGTQTSNSGNIKREGDTGNKKYINKSITADLQAATIRSVQPIAVADIPDKLLDITFNRGMAIAAITIPNKKKKTTKKVTKYTNGTLTIYATNDPLSTAGGKKVYTKKLTKKTSYTINLGTKAIWTTNKLKNYQYIYIVLTLTAVTAKATIKVTSTYTEATSVQSGVILITHRRPACWNIIINGEPVEDIVINGELYLHDELNLNEHRITRVGLDDYTNLP